ncbi:MAG TPA: molybdate ABC transporter substrate-binding protein [Chthoniobacteraceae bacterium]|nr:molybdate ABC transporter substrate-binding protein [Chthoniobacteraceae bacterium]
MKFPLSLLLAGIVAFCMAAAPSARAADEISIAAAADLAKCMQELNAAFQKDHPGANVKVSTGSSGNFFEQIKNGAPFDIFLSADIGYPKQLADAGLADKQSITVYAHGRIALWTTSDKIDVSKGLDILKDMQLIKKIAIANPDHAPYGRAAKAALEHYGLWVAVKDRLVIGENISQTAQFVQSGNADAGIVALSLIIDPKSGKAPPHTYVIPVDSYPPLEQAAVLTSAGSRNPLAKSYLEFLRSDAARKIFDRYGFLLNNNAQ